MKNKFGLLLALLAFLSLGIYSCTKDANIEPTATNTKTDIELRQLVKSALTDYPVGNTEAENLKSYEAFKKQYDQLNSNDLIRYYEIRVEEFDKMYEGQADREDMIAAATSLLEEVKFMNAKSNEQFGKNYTLLTDSELIAFDLKYKNEFDATFLNQKAKSRSCPFFDFNKVMRVSNTNIGVGCNGFSNNIGSADDGDCNDTDFSFPNGNKAMLNTLHTIDHDAYTYITGWRFGGRPVFGAFGSWWVNSRYNQWQTRWLAGRRLTSNYHSFKDYIKHCTKASWQDYSCDVTRQAGSCGCYD